MKFKKPKFWDYKKPGLLSYFLIPATLPFYLNNFFFKKKTAKIRSGIKTICIGNIYLGGTGKTPLSILIYQMLTKEKKKAVIIKKFYKDQMDEQKLIKKYAEVIISKNRLEGLKEAIIKNFDYAIFDDGLQDKSIDYNTKIVCFNNKQWIGNGLLIPAGPLRENIQSLQRFDAVVLNGNIENNFEIKKKIKNINTTIEIFETDYIARNSNKINKNSNFVVFSGIGNPFNFYDMLEKEKIKIIKKFEFPDHYNYSIKDLKKIKNYASTYKAEIITTEKDFLRLEDSNRYNINHLDLDLNVIDEKNLKTFIGI